MATTWPQKLEDNVLLLVCLLPLLVPFGLTRNIDLQAVVVSLNGGLAWVAVALRRPRFNLNWASGLLGLYALSCLASWLLHPSIANAFGGPLMRLGSLETLALIGVGLSLRHQSAQRLVGALYLSILALALFSLPYSVLQMHSLSGRVGGLPHQPDFLAATIAVGLLLGANLWHLRRWRPYLLATQLYLLIVMLMTQTRAVILLLAAIILLWIWRVPTDWQRKVGLTLLLALFLSLGVGLLSLSAPSRLTNSRYASLSLSYRLSLQHAALQASRHEPLTGYGLGSLNRPLACSGLHAPALLATCHQGYFFDSSHNVFLDNILGVGWLGGLSLVGFVGLALGQGLRRPTVFVSVTLLIALYYFTNPSDLEISSLFWIALLRPRKFSTGISVTS